MEFLCEDLRQFGVELIPPSAPEYDALRADIRWRFDDPVEGSPPIPDRMRGRIDDADRETSAILVTAAKTASRQSNRFGVSGNPAGTPIHIRPGRERTTLRFCLRMEFRRRL
jgi:hypothetical protein